MKVLLTFENPLPNRLADAEVFVNTARALAPHCDAATLLIPGRESDDRRVDGLLQSTRFAPLEPAWLRHLTMALTLPLRRAFRHCDLVYTRNLLIAATALLFGRRIVFDHYRPWGDQVPPLQPLLRALFNHPRCMAVFCHSALTADAYKRIGVEAEKLRVAYAGHDPALFRPRRDPRRARRILCLPDDRPLVVYAGRVNHKKGLDVVLDAAAATPEIDYALVGAEGGAAVEARAAGLPNVRLVPFLPQGEMAAYLQAADILLIPPATSPLQFFGSTVLPLKTYLYLGAGRPIVAGATPDTREILKHGENAWLVAPDRPDMLADALRTLLADPDLRRRLATGARVSAERYTWAARAEAIAATLRRRLDAPAPKRASPAGIESQTWRESWQWARQLPRTRYWAMSRSYR